MTIQKSKLSLSFHCSYLPQNLSRSECRHASRPLASRVKICTCLRDDSTLPTTALYFIFFQNKLENKLIIKI